MKGRTQIFRVFGLLSSLLIASLSHPSSDSATALKDRRPIVFVHGFGGSTLVDSTGAVRWLNGWECLGLKTPALALPLEWSNGAQSRDELRSEELLRKIQ